MAAGFRWFWKRVGDLGSVQLLWTIGSGAVTMLAGALGGLPVALWIVLGLGAAVIALAVAHLVVDLRNKTVAAPPTTEPISPKGRPEIGATLDGANIFVRPGPDGQTGIALNVRVWNAGEPVFITDWQLSVALEGHPSQQAQGSAIPPELKLTGEPDVTLRASESLVTALSSVKLKERPVAGVLLFYIDVEKDDVMQPDTRLELSLLDSQNRRTQISKRIGDWLKP